MKTTTPFGAFFLPAGLLLICWGLGVLNPFHFHPWLAFQHEAFVFAGLLPITGWLMWDAWRKPSTFLPNAFTPMALLLLALLCVQCLLLPAVYLGDAAVGAVYVSGIWIAWQLGVQKDPSQHNHFKAICLAWLSIGLVCALMAVVQFCELTPALHKWVVTPAQLHRATANLAQPNNLATLLLMAVVGAIWLYETAVITGAFAGVVVAVLSLGVLSAQSRTALLSAVGMVILKHLMDRKKTSSRVSTILTLVWCIAMVLCSWVIKYVSTYDEFHLNTPGVSEGRVIIWKQLLAGLQQSPWWGYGWLQTPAAQQAGALWVSGTEQTTYSHNLVLDLCVWLGAPLGLCISGLAGVWLFKRWRLAKLLRTQMAFAFALPLGVHSMLEMPFSYAYFLFPAAWVMGMIDRDTATTNATVPSWCSRSETLILVVFIGLTLWLRQDYLRVEDDYRLARFEKRNIGVIPADYVRPKLELLTQWDEVLLAMRFRIVPGMSDAQLAMLARSSGRFSWLALHHSYALALDLNGRHEEAALERKVMKGLFDDESYQLVLHSYRELAKTHYPELRQITLQ
jgi:Virulence factor membrane-bound polymerase, C-terminal/O-Antigen ligase/Protein glycosylation ligase